MFRKKKPEANLEEGAGPVVRAPVVDSFPKTKYYVVNKKIVPTTFANVRKHRGTNQ